MNSMRAFSFALIALGLSACAGTTRSEAQFPSIDPEDVAVFTSEADLPEGYVLVEAIRLGAAPRYGQAQDPTDRARARAAVLGADILLILEESQEIADSRIRVAASQGGSYSRLSFFALRSASD